jgi:hypothetical protein
VGVATSKMRSFVPLLTIFYSWLIAAWGAPTHHQEWKMTTTTSLQNGKLFTGCILFTRKQGWTLLQSNLSETQSQLWTYQAKRCLKVNNS